MNFQLTDAAVEALNGTHGPISLTVFRLGSAANYIPSPSDTGLRGTEVYSGTISSPIAMNANIVKYSLYLDYDVGPFSFGEAALYAQLPNQSAPFLFALGARATLIDKFPLSDPRSNAIRADTYLSMVGVNYEMWLDLAESNNKFRIAIAESPDQIPPSRDAVPNTYIVKGVGSNSAASIAYTDRSSLWNFDRYFQSAHRYEITAATNRSVTIRGSDFSDDLVPTYKGQKILQFSTGAVYGICRYVSSATITGTDVVLQFDTTLAVVPKVGDLFFILTRQADASEVSLPIASTSNLGGIVVGEGLSVNSAGLLRVSEPWLSTKSVSSINGQRGHVEIIGLINPMGLVAGQNLNEVLEPGLYYASSEVVNTLVNGPGPVSDRLAGTLEVLPSLEPIPGGDVIQRWTQDSLILVRKRDGGTWSNWAGISDYILPPATTASLGGVVAGPGLAVNDQGLLSAQVRSVNGMVGDVSISYDDLDVPIANESRLGVVSVGSGLSVTLDGSLSVNLPIASSTVLGGIKVGNGLDIDPSGVLSATGIEVDIATRTRPGIMQVGAGLSVNSSGLVSVNWDSAPFASKDVPGMVKVGSGLSINNGVVSLDYTLPTASSSVLGGIRVGEGLSIDGNGILSASGGSTGTIDRIEAGSTTAGDVVLVKNSPVTEGTAVIKSIRAPVGYGVAVEDSNPDGVAIRYLIPSFTVTTAPVITWGSSNFTSNQYIRYAGTADINVVVPQVTNANFLDRSPEIHFRQVGTGKITFVPGPGNVVIYPPFKGTLTTAGPGSTITLKSVSADGREFDLIGQVEEE